VTASFTVATRRTSVTTSASRSPTIRAIPPISRRNSDARGRRAVPVRGFRRAAAPDALHRGPDLPVRLGQPWNGARVRLQRRPGTGDRLPGVGKFSEDGPNFSSLDLRVTYACRWRAGRRRFHRRGLQSVHRTTGTSTRSRRASGCRAHAPEPGPATDSNTSYGKYFNTLPPQEAQLGVRLTSDPTDRAHRAPASAPGHPTQSAGALAGLDPGSEGHFSPCVPAASAAAGHRRHGHRVDMSRHATIIAPAATCRTSKSATTNSARGSVKCRARGVRRQDGSQHRHQDALAIAPDWATSDSPCAPRARAREGRQAARGGGPHHPRHRLARLHHAGHLGRRAAQARRAQRGHVRHRLRLRLVPTGSRPPRDSSPPNPSLATVLVVGVYMMQKLADSDDPTIFFYGDGAGAACSHRPTRPASSARRCRPTGLSQALGHLLGRHLRAGHRGVGEGRSHEGEAARALPARGEPRRLATAGAAARGPERFAVADIDFIVFTQVRRPSVELVMADLGLPMERTLTNMDRCGYTGSACIPSRSTKPSRRVASRPAIWSSSSGLASATTGGAALQVAVAIGDTCCTETFSASAPGSRPPRGVFEVATAIGSPTPASTSARVASPTPGSTGWGSVPETRSVCSPTTASSSSTPCSPPPSRA